MNQSGFPATSARSERTTRRHTRLLQIIPYSAPPSRPVCSVPQYRELNFDNSSRSVSSGISVTNTDTLNDDLNYDILDNTGHSSLNHEDQVQTSSEVNTQTSTFDFQREFLNIVLKYSVPYTAAEELMSIINKESGTKKFPLSIKTLLRKQEKYVYSCKYTIVCDCGSSIAFQSENGTFPSKVTCTSCTKNFNGYVDLKKYAFYLYLPMLKQIKLISEVYFPPENPNNVIDGCLVLPLILTIDAIPIFKSVKSSLHVMTVFIDGMKRHGKDAIPLLTTLYYEKSKPSVQVFFDEFLKEFMELSTTPFQTCWSTNTRISLKCILADAPCRAWILGMQQFNGKHGCHRCYIETQNSRYPMLTVAQLRYRSFEDTENIRSLPGSSNRFGVLRETPLSAINDFDYIKNTPVEYIHCAILGVMKNMVKCVFVESQWGKRAFISNEKPSFQYFERELANINVPSSIKRFRSLKEMNDFKSSEYENLLFYYAYPLFREKMKPDFLIHILLLSSALSKLLEPENSGSIAEARNEINLFLELVSILQYPDFFRTYNTHSLLHLPDDAENIGPLKNYNAYGYENFLGHLKRLVRCPTNVCQQIIHQIKVTQVIDNHLHTIQLTHRLTIDDGMSMDLLPLGYSIEQVTAFSKCKYGNYSFECWKPHFTKRKKDYNICINDKLYRIKYFINYHGNDFVVCNSYSILRNFSFKSRDINVTLKYAFYVRLKDDLKVVQLAGTVQPLIEAKTVHNTLLYRIITNNN